MKPSLTSSPRRRFLRDLGLSAAVLPFLGGLPSLQAAPRKRSAPRIVFVFTPNGTVPNEFWPETAGTEFQLKSILEPLAAYRNQMLILKGLCNRVRGDGDGHSFDQNMIRALVLAAALGVVTAAAAYPPPPPTFDAKSYTTWAPLNIHVRAVELFFIDQPSVSTHGLRRFSSDNSLPLLGFAYTFLFNPVSVF